MRDGHVLHDHLRTAVEDAEASPLIEVVRVHDGVRLAAKCIDQGPLSTWARKQLVCEVEIQQSLQHPSILRMHAAGEDAASGKYVSIQDVAYGG